MAKILLVDDDAIKLLLAAIALLERVDAHIQLRQMGSDALDLLAKERIDVMVTDCNMPSMDGLELIEHLRSGEFEGRSLELNRAIPVIIRSGNDFEPRTAGVEDRWSRWEPIAVGPSLGNWDKLVDDIRQFVPLPPITVKLTPDEIFAKYQSQLFG